MLVVSIQFLGLLDLPDPFEKEGMIKLLFRLN